MIVDQAPACRRQPQDHGDPGGRFILHVPAFEPDIGVRVKEGECGVAKDVNLYVPYMFFQYLVEVFRKGGIIALNGCPTLDWLFHLLCNIDQRIVRAVPDRLQFLWIEVEKAQSVCLDQICNGMFSVSMGSC